MNRNRRRIAALPAVLLLGAGALLGACGDDDPDDSSASTEVAASPGGADDRAGQEISVTAAWARSSPAMTTAGAVYMVIDNPTDTDDALVAASVDPSVAGTVELHESSMAEESDGGDATAGSADGARTGDAPMDGEDAGGSHMGPGTEEEGAGGGGGMMTMKPVDEVPVPAGGTAVLEPGGYHVMLLDVPEPLAAGDTIEVTLTFENAGELLIDVEVRDDAP